MLQTKVTKEAVTSHALVNEGEQDLKPGSWNHPQTDWVSWTNDPSNWISQLCDVLLESLQV